MAGAAQVVDVAPRLRPVGDRSGTDRRLGCGSRLRLARVTGARGLCRFVLIDVGETASAVEQLAYACEVAEGTAPPLLRAWLSAAHGEGLAAVGDRDGALRAAPVATVGALVYDAHGRVLMVRTRKWSNR